MFLKVGESATVRVYKHPDSLSHFSLLEPGSALAQPRRREVGSGAPARHCQQLLLGAPGLCSATIKDKILLSFRGEKQRF